MLDMFKHSMMMFLKGKLFRDNKMVARQGAIGVITVMLLITLLGKFVVPMWLAAIIGGFVGGALMPYLFKDLKYN
jgi:hypothetical protein